MVKPRKTVVSRSDTRRHPPSPISRRGFIQGAVAVSAAAGAAALPAKARGGNAPTSMRDAVDSAGAGEDARGYAVLTPEQGRVLGAILNRIIPANDVMPGAGDAGVARFVDGVLVDAPHLRLRVIALLNEADARERFAGLPEAAQDARLRELARHRKDAFDTLLRAAYTGYYSEPRVLAAIGRRPRPDGPGPTEPFDTSRLDAVRKRGPIYRDASTGVGRRTRSDPDGGAS
jgi:hypothetical protein